MPFLVVPIVRAVLVHTVPVRAARFWQPFCAVLFTVGSGLPVPVPFIHVMGIKRQFAVHDLPFFDVSQSICQYGLEAVQS